MKKGVIIPAALFAAVFCISLFCQRYSLIFRENIGLFLLTPDWLREVFSRPLPLSNFAGSFLGQFYSDSVFGPMIPAAVITVIYLCLNAFLRKCKVPYHRLIATALALTAWCLTASLSTLVAVSAVMLICLALALISCLLPVCHPAGGRWWEVIVALVLIIGSAVFVGVRKDIRNNEQMAKVVVSAGKADWTAVLKVATPDKVKERPLMMPFALLALNGQVKLGESMFRYPVTGPECLDLHKEKNAIGNIFQSYLFETLGVPNEAIHQMFQFSTNFDHGMTHLSLRRLIKSNIDAGNYRMATKYAEILRHNPYYSLQAKKIVKKYGSLEDLTDSLELHSSVAPALSQDAVYDILQLSKCGHHSPEVIDRLLAYLLLERNLDDFFAIFYSYDWTGKTVPAHYQEAILLKGEIRGDIVVNPETRHKYEAFMAAFASMDIATAESLSKGTYWEYYYRQTASQAENQQQ